MAQSVQGSIRVGSKHTRNVVDLEMKHARESKSRIGGLRVVQITALGISAKSFLIEHFRRLREAGAEVTLVCSDDDDARYTAELTGIRYCPLQIKPNMAPFSDIVSLCRGRFVVSDRTWLTRT